MSAERIYLDHAATTPLRPEARAAMARGFDLWANPSSPHAAGRAARAALEDARERIKAALEWDGELIFTASASEALAIGLGRAKAERKLVSAVEHDAVFRAAPDAEVLPIGDRRADWDNLAAALARGGRAVVAIQQINSETGTVLDVDSAGEIVRDAGGLLLSDCSQSAGKVGLPQADMIVVSAHKLGGPVGIGALLVQDFAMIEPVGGQERGYRAGTENLPAALGFAAALEAGGIDGWATTSRQRRDFQRRLCAYGQPVSPGLQCSHIFAVASAMSANAMLMRMDGLGFAISAGSACSSGTLKQSRVLEGFEVESEVARRTLRISLGWSTTPDELDAFADAWRDLNA